MPMAGEGQRFKKEGYNFPKPLIELEGKPLFLHAIDSVKPDNIELKYSLIIRQEHIDTYSLDKEIKKLIPEANVFSVEKTTRGAVETCLMAESAIDDKDAVIIIDCDLEFSSEDFINFIKRSLSESPETVRGGALVSFHSNNPRYSYALSDENGWVIKTAEKEVISQNALCGAYFFASGKKFKQIAHKLLDEPVMTKPEFYLSLLYNYLIWDHEPVKLTHIDTYRSFGTPEELKQWK